MRQNDALLKIFNYYSWLKWIKESEGKIIRVSGPLVVAENMKGSRMYDVVHVGEEKLVGEIIELEKDLASIQVYKGKTDVSAIGRSQ